jgi:vacuolar-type H+-ATPase subunit H
VPDRSEVFRKVARECLQLARKTTDENARAVLVTLAQKSLDLASGSAADDQLDAVLQEFNDQKMSEH